MKSRLRIVIHTKGIEAPQAKVLTFRLKILVNTKEMEAPQARILQFRLKIVINTKQMEVPRAMILKSRLKILIKYKGNWGAAGEDFEIPSQNTSKMQSKSMRHRTNIP